MPDISRIVIKSSSGYCSYDEAYQDKIIITAGSISYEYNPYVESEINPKRKWSYKTNSPIFKKAFDEIVIRLPDALGVDEKMFATDIGATEFNITYSDKTKFKKSLLASGRLLL